MTGFPGSGIEWELSVNRVLEEKPNKYSLFPNSIPNSRIPPRIRRKRPDFRTSSRAREELSLKRRPSSVPTRLSALAGAGLPKTGPRRASDKNLPPSARAVKRRRAPETRYAAPAPHDPPTGRPRPSCATWRDPAAFLRVPGDRRHPHRGGGLGSPPEGARGGAAGRCPLTKETCLQPGKSPKALPVGAYGAIGATRFAPCHGGTIQPTFRHFSQPPQHP